MEFGRLALTNAEAVCYNRHRNFISKGPRPSPCSTNALKIKILLHGEQETTMARKVTDGCIGCGACEGTCPVGAITLDGGVAVIDAAGCIDCGACEGGCPVGAIVAE